MLIFTKNYIVENINQTALNTHKIYQTMSDRLTQLQICLDQLIEQFCATLNYVDKNHDFVPSGEGEEKMTDPQATIAPELEFKDTMNELSTDLIVKTRQILTLIDSLPGADASPKDQLLRIRDLQKELLAVQKEKTQVVRKKDDLLQRSEDLIVQFSTDLIDSKKKD
jgi:mediator of RNA polymerase II transcription subunit 21